MTHYIVAVSTSSSPALIVAELEHKPTDAELLSYAQTVHGPVYCITGKAGRTWLPTDEVPVPAPKPIRLWRIRYMNAHMLPPYPFGKTEETIEATSREDAIDRIKAMRGSMVSLEHRITASPVK